MPICSSVRTLKSQGGRAAATPGPEQGLRAIPVELPKKCRGTLCHLLPRESRRSEEGRGPSPGCSTGASGLREARGESNFRIWSQRPELLTVIPLPEGGGARVDSRATSEEVRSIPHGRNLESRVASEPKLARDLRRDRMWRRLRVDRSRARLAFECVTAPKSGSLGLRHCLPSETGPRRSATGRPARGQTFSAGWAGWCLEALPKQAGSRRVSGVTAEAGLFRDVSESSGGTRQVEASVILWFQHRASRCPLT